MNKRHPTAQFHQTISPDQKQNRFAHSFSEFGNPGSDVQMRPVEQRRHRRRQENDERIWTQTSLQCKILLVVWHDVP